MAIFFTFTLFHMTLGHIDPDYHESACCYHIVRAKFTKMHDFVPFDSCQDPVRLLLTFTFNKTEDPSVPYAGQGYVKHKRISQSFTILEVTIRDPRGSKGKEL